MCTHKSLFSLIVLKDRTFLCSVSTIVFLKLLIIEEQFDKIAGTKIVVTSPSSALEKSVVRTTTDDVQVAQASNKDASHFECGLPDNSTISTVSTMETEKRNNKTSETSSNGTKNMEIEAATKIQAGFRGYQVRKQLKMKVIF